MTDKKLILNKLKEYKNFTTDKDFANFLSISSANLSAWYKRNTFDENKIVELFPEVSRVWILTGEGDMFCDNTNATSVVDASSGKLIPLLPVSAQGGTLGEFTMSVHMRDCEKILSPIRGVDFGIRVSGDSMSPEYPSGSIILIKKIDHRAFIEWGRCYVLDTQNGIVVKKISAPDVTDINLGLDYLYCVSVNPEPIYKPFRVPTESIIGIYRVKMLLDEK